MLLQIVFRPYPEGRISPPVHVRSVGHYIVTPDWTCEMDRRPILQFFWGVSGVGRFDGGSGGAWRLTPGRIGCFLPGDRHRIRAETPEFDYWWFTLDGPSADALIAAFRLPRGGRPAGPCPEALFERLFREVREPDMDAELAAGATAYRILTASMRNPPDGERGVAARFRKLVADGCGDPDFSVAEIARTLGVHRSTLARIVARHCGQPPSEYLTGQRLALALKLLQDGSRSIKEVAALSGFASRNYFSKVFRRRFGRRPGDMRNW